MSMSTVAATDSQVLKRLDYPAYCVKLLDNGLVAIAGGGGTSKTGVTNWIEIGHINYSSSSSSTSSFQSELKLIAKLETVDAIMKFVSFSSSGGDLYLVAAVNDVVEIYKIQPVITTAAQQQLDEHNTTNNHHANGANSSSSIRQRKTSTSKPSAPIQNGTIKHHNYSAASSHQLEASAELKLVNQIQLRDNNNNKKTNNNNKQTSEAKTASQTTTAAASEESIVSLQVYKDESATIMLCVGTSTGSILVWNLEFETNNNHTNKINVVKLHEFEHAHGNSEIDDLQVNKDGQLLSIGKDGKVCVWSLRDMKKLCDVDYERGMATTASTRIRMKHARFSQDAHSSYLYTTYIPRVRQPTKQLCSYVQRWRRTAASTASFGYKPERCFKLAHAIITSVQSSRDGLFVTMGDSDGHIYLLDAELRRVKNFRRHHTSVITDLIFYHDCDAATADLNKLMVSISIDRTIQLYKFINTSPHLLISSTSSSYSPTSATLAATLSCCLSMKLFQFAFLLLVSVLLFCYFFTHIE